MVSSCFFRKRKFFTGLHSQRATRQSRFRGSLRESEDSREIEAASSRFHHDRRGALVTNSRAGVDRRISSTTGDQDPIGVIARIWFAAVGVMAAAEITAHAGASYRSGSSLSLSARDA